MAMMVKVQQEKGNVRGKANKYILHLILWSFLIADIISLILTLVQVDSDE